MIHKKVTLHIVSTSLLAISPLIQAVQTPSIIPFSVVQDPTGTIVSAGGENTGDTTRAVLLALNTSGDLQTSFGAETGIAPVSIDKTRFTNVILASGAKFIACGLQNGPPAKALLARFTSSGLLDTTFDTDGQALYSFGQGGVNARDIVQLPSNDIVACGTRVLNYSPRAFSFMANNSGTLTSWGITGAILVNSFSRACSIHRTSATEVVISGIVGSSTIFSAKLDATTGTLVGAYGTSGLVEIALPNATRCGLSILDSATNILYISSLQLDGLLSIHKIDNTGTVVDTFTHQLDPSLAVGALEISSDGNTVYVSLFSDATSLIAGLDTTTGAVENSIELDQFLFSESITFAGEGDNIPLPFGLHRTGTTLYTVGIVNEVTMVMKLNENLTVDTSFGTEGIATFPANQLLTGQASFGDYIFAYSTQNQDVLTSWNAITFNGDVFSDNAWALSGTREFICPATGVYQLGYTLNYLGNAGVASRFVQNGTELTGSRSHFSPKVVDFAGQSSHLMLAELSSNDVIEVEHIASEDTVLISTDLSNATISATGGTPISGSVTISRIE